MEATVERRDDSHRRRFFVEDVLDTQRHVGIAEERLLAEVVVVLNVDRQHVFDDRVTQLVRDGVVPREAGNGREESAGSGRDIESSSSTQRAKAYTRWLSRLQENEPLIFHSGSGRATGVELL